MKVLLLTQILPYPPDSGPKVKTFNVIKYLSEHHKLTLVSFVRGDQSAAVESLKQYCQAVYTVPIQRGAIGDGLALVRSLLTNQPFLMVRDDRLAMRRLLDGLSSQEHFDVVHVDQLNMAQYARRLPGVRRVLDAHNAVWLLFKRLCDTMPAGPKKLLLGRDWRLLKRYEGQICREFDSVIAVSEEDRAALEEAAGCPLDALVVPISVDVDAITPVHKRPTADHILHMGTMYWPPNVDGILWFLKRVYPIICRHRPEIAFDVVGANPPPEITAFGKNNRHIHVTGYLEDPQPYLENARLMVVPLRAGGGMRVKILNAMASGIPVVSTTIGYEGIQAEPGHHLLVADSPEDFAAAVLQLLDDSALASRLGQAGRQLIETTYDYRVACKGIDQAYGLHHPRSGVNEPLSNTPRMVEGKESS